MSVARRNLKGADAKTRTRRTEAGYKAGPAGNAAMDADARYSLVKQGRVDPARPERKAQQLNLGDLSSCEGRPAKATTLSAWQHVEKGREKSAEAVVVCLSEGGNPRRGGPTMPRKSG